MALHLFESTRLTGMVGGASGMRPRFSSGAMVGGGEGEVECASSIFSSAYLSSCYDFDGVARRRKGVAEKVVRDA